MVKNVIELVNADITTTAKKGLRRIKLAFEVYVPTTYNIVGFSFQISVKRKMSRTVFKKVCRHYEEEGFKVTYLSRYGTESHEDSQFMTHVVISW